MFPTRSDFSQAWDTAPALNASARVALTNEFHLGGIDIMIPLTVSGINGTAAAVGAGLLDCVRNVRLTVADGSTPRNVIDASGCGLIERAASITGKLDYNTNAARNTAAGNLPGNGAYIVTIPLSMLCNLYPPFNLATILPLPKYSAKPELVVSLAPATDMTTAQGVTIALTSTPVLVLHRYRVPNGIPFPTFPFEISEKLATFSVTGQQIVELDTPGVYTDLTLRNFLANGTRSTILSGGEARLQRLGVNLHRWTEATLALETARNMAVTPFTGVLLKNFIGAPQDGVDSLDGALDANILIGTGARVQLIQQIGVASYQKIVSCRIFSDVSALRRYTAVSLV
jgi:hypothetical protein